MKVLHIDQIWPTQSFWHYFNDKWPNEWCK